MSRSSTSSTASLATTAVAADLGAPAVLDDGVAEAFERDGYTRLCGVLEPDTVAAFAPIVADVAARSAQAKVPLGERSVYQRAFVQEVNLWQRIEAVRPLVFSTK